MPPTEKKGRRQSSEIKVITIEDNSRNNSKILNKKDVTEEFIRTTGNGGQNRNKRESCVRLTHNPSGIQVVSDGERTQAQNRVIAWGRLEEKLLDVEANRVNLAVRDSKREALDSGEQWVWTEWRDEVRGPGGSRYSYKNMLRGKFRLR